MIEMHDFCAWSITRIGKVFKRGAPVIVLILGVIVFLYKWRIICLNMEPKLHVAQVCTSFKNGQSIGNLCRPLCQSREAIPVSCHSSYSEKAVVFSGLWMNSSTVLKSITTVHHHDLSDKFLYSNNDNSVENDFVQMIKTIVKIKFNLSINNIDAKRMSYIQFSQEGGNRYTEMKNVWPLLQDNEYLAMLLYEKFDIFPKLLGTCGTLYAVQKLDSISGYWNLMTLYDSQTEWVKRVKISLMILDFLLRLEEELPEPMLICDVKMNHFGVTNDFKKVKYLDLDTVHPLSVVNKIISSNGECREHSDCDLSDCRSFCNMITHKCQHGVANNNLQIVCERIFLGWMMSGRIMVPGLLFGPRAPIVLIEVLENCANPLNENGTPRSAAGKEIRDRLYNILAHLV